jgi:4-hydroxy-tetrahydrodipicolinate synthase
MNMSQKLPIKGLWVPLITPFYQDSLDGPSLIKLIKETESFVDGFITCLSTGEGEKADDLLWESIVRIVTNNTNKPVAAGILRSSIGEIVDLSKVAKRYGCVAIAVTIQGDTARAQENFSREVSEKSALPVVLYNTQKSHMDDAGTLMAISKNENIIALKDSSQNQKFFDEAVGLNKKGGIDISILQGMENQLLNSTGADGFVLSLANAEPKLCKQMFVHPTKELNAQIMQKWEELNLASETWYVGIKEVLESRGIIKSAELID